MTGESESSTTGTDDETSDIEVAARCHEIQTGLGKMDVPDFDLLSEIGMVARLAIHIRGLPAINYTVLKLVAVHMLQIPSAAVKSVVYALGEIEFARLSTEGRTIKTVLPNVPYYRDLYQTLGEYANAEDGFNETEVLSLEMMRRLASAPEKVDSLRDSLGAENELFERTVDIGTTGNYLVQRRFRGRDILISPAYFSENPEIFADVVASAGANSVKAALDAVRSVQGVPLAILLERREIGGSKLTDEQMNLMVRLAQDGIVKPPSIETSYSGENFFMFTPTPGAAALPVGKREIYERAMAIVASIRQGQFLPQRFAIRNPAAVIGKLYYHMQLDRATTEATQQYKNLVHLRVGRLEPVKHGYSKFSIIDTPENKEALSIAYDLITRGTSEGMEVDEEARKALQQPQDYVESIVASSRLRERRTVNLNEAQQQELELLFLQSSSQSQ